MQTTSGFLTYLGQRLGALGVPFVVVLLLGLALAIGLAAFAVSDLLALGADPVQVAPVRWPRHY